MLRVPASNVLTPAPPTAFPPGRHGLSPVEAVQAEALASSTMDARHERKPPGGMRRTRDDSRIVRQHVVEPTPSSPPPLL